MIGCYAQLKPDEIASIPGVDLVLGAAEKFNVQQYVDGISKAPEKGLVKAGEISTVSIYEEAYSFGDRTRTFLKVQDGCDYKCSFCTIPRARGKSRSSSIDRVIDNARKIVEQGVQEIVLTGVNIGDFGITPEGKRVAGFIDLLHALEQVDGISRIRISSIEPNLCSDDIINQVAISEKVVPHLHMPLQSGSDVMLSAMRRRYRTALYRDRVAKIKKLMPHCCIGVDVIVGFPGEGEAEFRQTVDFLEELDISYLHVFTYSERANTSAPELDGKVPMNVRRERNKTLRQLSDSKRALFYDQHLGTSRQVLFESTDVDGRLSGFTDNYIKVSVPYDEALTHTMRLVDLQKRQGHLCHGQALSLSLHE